MQHWKAVLVCRTTEKKPSGYGDVNHIHMIVSIKRNPGTTLESKEKKLGTEHEGDVNRTKEKATIQFGPANGERLQASHNDAVVITAAIGGYNVRRVLMDSGSVIYIITPDCYRKIDLRMEPKAAK